MTLTQALQRSLNTVAAALADQVGRDKVAATARLLGINSPINTDPAMALGTSQVSPLEMAQAYDSFSNGGRAVKAYAIERIRTRDGQVLYQHADEPRSDVVPQPQLGQLVGMMRQGPGSARHRRPRGPFPAMTSPARPAPPAIFATPGSSATPAALRRRSGSARTITRRCTG